MKILCVVIGYLCGCFLTADVVARLRTGKSAFLLGSGNPGMANIGHVLGVKWAVITLVGDVLKTALACLVCRYVLFPGLGGAAVLYAGVGAALGHGFPFWHRLKGGRSVAVSCMYMILFAPVPAIIVELAGLCAVILTGYLAVGAITMPVLFLYPVFRFYGMEDGLVALAGAAVTLLLHRDSIVRMIRGQEEKADLFLKLKRNKRSI